MAAGSAKLSREGSRIACEESVNYCIVQLNDNKKFEEAISKYNEQKEDGESEARKQVGDYMYKIVGAAAFKAHRAINAEAATANNQPKQYATTLLLTISKKFPFGWFLASFWVGMVQSAFMTDKHIQLKYSGNPMKVNMQGQDSAS